MDAPLPSIKFLSGPLVGKTLTLHKSIIDIGRDAQNDIVIPDPRVSRQHATIHLLNGTWVIENRSQSSFIVINQQQVQQGSIYNNSVVSLGEDTSFVFVVPAQAAQRVEPLRMVPPALPAPPVQPTPMRAVNPSIPQMPQAQPVPLAPPAQQATPQGGIYVQRQPVQPPLPKPTEPALDPLAHIPSAFSREVIRDVVYSNT